MRITLNKEELSEVIKDWAQRVGYQVESVVLPDDCAGVQINVSVRLAPAKKPKASVVADAGIFRQPPSTLEPRQPLHPSAQD